MRPLILILMLACVTTDVFAQGLKTKVGTRILPPSADTSKEVAKSPTTAPQDDIVRRLLLPDFGWDLRAQALDEALTLDPQTIGPELRKALITTLARENARERAREAAYKDREVLDDRGEIYAEFRFRAIGAVIRLRDTNAIPVLVEALGTGNAVINGLVQFGDLAAPAVLEHVRSSQMYVEDGLRTLMKMVQAGVLRPNTREAVRLVANERLSGTQEFTVILNAMELAAALGTPELRSRLQGLANDPAVVQKLGPFDDEDQQALRRAAVEALKQRQP